MLLARDVLFSNIKDVGERVETTNDIHKCGH